MSPVPLDSHEETDSVPRASGDEPYTAPPARTWQACSPRERG